MAKVKFDAVIEAAHYSGDGQLEWVRAYERRGAAYADLSLIRRAELAEMLKAGKKVAAGKRQRFQGSSFEIGPEIKLAQQNGKEVLFSSAGSARSQDFLEGVPVV